MAATTIDEICAICKNPISPGFAVYLTKVTLTPNSLNSLYGRKVPTGKLRIKLLGNSQPKTCIHVECYQQNIEGLFK